MDKRKKTLQRERSLVGAEVSAEHGEPQASFELFCEYLLMERRSLRELATRSLGFIGKTVTFKQIGKYSAKFDWQSRAKAFDSACRHLSLSALLERRSDALLEIWDKEIAMLQESGQKLSDAIFACDVADYKRLRWLIAAMHQRRAVVSELTAEQLQLWGVKIDDHND